MALRHALATTTGATSAMAIIFLPVRFPFKALLLLGYKTVEACWVPLLRPCEN